MPDADPFLAVDPQLKAPKIDPVPGGAKPASPAGVSDEKSDPFLDVDPQLKSQSAVSPAGPISPAAKPKGFANRMKQAVGLHPKLPPDQWAQKVVAMEGNGGFMSHMQDSALFGFGPDIDAHIATAMYGKEYGEAIRKAERAASNKYGEDHPARSGVADFAGSLAGMEGVGSLLEGGGKLASRLAPRATEWVGDAAKGTGKAIKSLFTSTPARVAVGGAGAAVGAEKNPEHPFVGAAEGAAAGAAVPFFLRSTAEGAALGALQGAGNADPGHMEQGAVAGAIPGAAVGAALPIAGYAGKELYRAADSASGYKLTEAAERWNERMGRPSGTPVSGPELAAAKRLKPSLEAEKLTADKAMWEQAARKKAGIKEGNLYQVAEDEGAVQRQLRVAGKHPGGSAAAKAEMRRAESDLPDQLTARARVLTPDHDRTVAEHVDHLHDELARHVAPKSEHTIDEHRQHLADERSGKAATEYRPAYAAPVKLDPKAIESLDSKKMREAMDVALETGHENLGSAEKQAQIEDINKIKRYYKDRDAYIEKFTNWKKHGGVEPPAIPLSGWGTLNGLSPDARSQALIRLGGKKIPEPKPPALPEVSAGALDQIIQAADEVADNHIGTRLKPGDKPKLGNAIKGRTKALNDYINKLPHMETARANYREYSQRIDRLKNAGKDIIKMEPRDFARSLEDMPPETKEDMKIAFREIIPHDPEGIVKLFDRNPNLEKNLPAFMGEAEAQRTINLVKRMRATTEGFKAMQGEPADFARYMKDHPEVAKEDLRVALREQLTGADSGKRASVIAEMLESRSKLKANMVHLLGEGEAQSLIDAARIMREDRSASKFVAGTGSSTQRDTADAQVLGAILHHSTNPAGFIRQAVTDFIKQGNTMTREEAEAMVRLGQGDPDRLLKILEEHPETHFSTTMRLAIAKTASGIVVPDTSGDDDGPGLDVHVTDDGTGHAPDATPTPTGDGQ